MLSSLHRPSLTAISIFALSLSPLMIYSCMNRYNHENVNEWKKSILPRLFIAHLLLIDCNCPIFASFLAILSSLLTRIHINSINGSFKLMTSKPIHFAPFLLLPRSFLYVHFNAFSSLSSKQYRNMFQFSSCLKFDFLMPFLCVVFNYDFNFVSILSFHHLMVSHSCFKRKTPQRKHHAHSSAD